MPASPTDFQHALILSEREELCAVERHSLRQLGLPFVQHLSEGSRALELIGKNNTGFRSARVFHPGRFPVKTAVTRTGAPTHPEPGSLPVDLVICTERLEDTHSLPFIEKLRAMPGQANIALLMFPDSTRLWREAEKLGACCLSRPYTMHDLRAVLRRARHLAQKTFVSQSLTPDTPAAGPRSGPRSGQGGGSGSGTGYGPGGRVMPGPSGVPGMPGMPGMYVTSGPDSRQLSGSGAKPDPPAVLSSVVGGGRSDGAVFAAARSEGGPDDNRQSNWEGEWLGLAKPEPPKREPFPLIDDDVEEMRVVKREPFPLVDDDDEMAGAFYFGRFKREPFPLVDDGDFVYGHTDERVGERPEHLVGHLGGHLGERMGGRVGRHIRGVSAEPHAGSSYFAAPERSSRVSAAGSEARPEVMAGSLSRLAAGPGSDDAYAKTGGSRPSLEQAEHLLAQGYHINAAQAFLKAPESAFQGQSLHDVIARACQFTAAPEDNLRAMGKAMDIIGHPALSYMLERRLIQMYGGGAEPRAHPLFKAFPFLEDVLSVAQMTFSAWREPDEGLMELG